MRRSQTSRPSHRPSQSSSLGGSAEFGFLRDASLRNGRPTIDQDLSRPDSAASSTRRRPRETTASPFDLSIKHEADEQEGEMTIEAQLRRDVREAQKEIERLNSMAAGLQTQLAARPPLAKVQALEKEYSQLELLYHSTQRENQTCMSELEKIKRRERILETELAKHFGDNWMDDLNLTAQLNPTAISGPGSSPVLEKRNPLGSVSARRPSVVTRGLSTSSHRPSSSTQTLGDNSRPVSPSRASSSPNLVSALPPSSSTLPALPEHLEQIRSLILGMDQKLKIQEEKLQTMAADARAGEKKYERLLATSNASLTTLSNS